MTNNDINNNHINNIQVKDIWDSCLAVIKDIVEYPHYKTWFEPIIPLSWKDNVLTIQIPSAFFYEYIEDHYASLLAKTLKRKMGKLAKLEYKMMVDPKQSNFGSLELPSQTEKKTAPSELPFPSSSFEQLNVKNPFVIPGLKKVLIDSQLNPHYTYDSFLEGDCNKVAFAAGKRIACDPGNTPFNPLVIYGHTGLGKTHLIHAIGHETKQLHPNKVVLYVSSERFINQFQDHAINKNINDFIHFYQLVDVLILDDVQFFQRAEKTQEAFFAIFNHLHQSGKQLILTSDKSPNDLAGIQDRLLSRFKYGLSTDLQEPNFNTRVDIIKLKTKQEGVSFSEDVIKMIATSITSNIRELQGAILSLLAQSSFNNKEINVELTKKILRNFTQKTTKEITIESIQKLVCDYYQLPYDSVFEKTRKRNILQARQITMFLTKQFTKNSLQSIGKHFRGMDHTSVIHSCEVVKNLIETEESFKDAVKEIETQVQMIGLV